MMRGDAIRMSAGEKRVEARQSDEAIREGIVHDEGAMGKDAKR